MTTSFAVRFRAIKVVIGRRRPYGVRWVVGGREHSDWFVTRALADSHGSELMQAARRGEPFDTETGLPESTRRAQESRTLLDFAEGYVAMKVAPRVGQLPPLGSGRPGDRGGRLRHRPARSAICSRAPAGGSRSAHA